MSEIWVSSRSSLFKARKHWAVHWVPIFNTDASQPQFNLLCKSISLVHEAALHTSVITSLLSTYNKASASLSAEFNLRYQLLFRFLSPAMNAVLYVLIAFCIELIQKLFTEFGQHLFLLVIVYWFY